MPRGNNAAADNAALEKSDKKKKHDKDDNNHPGQETAVADNSSPCDKALWQRVYNHERLEVLDECKTVTGVIEERDADDDGDEHMLLKLDAGQDALLTKRNEKKKQGDLVIEAVCVNQPKLKKVGQTCDGYTNQVRLPKVGDHVRVTGSYVNDTHNDWTEIHPITRIEIIN